MMTDYRSPPGRNENHFAIWTLAMLSVLAFLAYAANSAYYPKNILDMDEHTTINSTVLETGMK